MALRLELKAGQSLVMTPQLQQSIKLLQLSNLELAAVIDRELAENRLLQYADEADTASEPAIAPAPSPSLMGATLSWSRPGVAADDMPSDFPPPEGPSLRAHLEEQLNLAAASAKQRMIGLNLIDMVDEAGYLRGDTSLLVDRLNVSREDVERTLGLVQSFDPPGVAARNLAECLAIQLREKGRFDPMIETLLQHLDLIAQQNLPKLARLCGADIEDVREMIADVRQLDPKPGLRFGGAPIAQITPDVFVDTPGDGGWHVELNSQTLPRLLVDRAYVATVRARASREDRAFLGECLNAANWLVRSLDQRARTILRVAEEIVRKQEAFLRHGAEYLQPMTLRDIASAIDMHESTVSRASAHKYMATPRGLFEFRYFFNSAVAGADGESAHSSEAVRYRIKQLVDAETPEAVLSDDQIAEALKASGIDVARRTVAKYREQLRVPSSRERRRAKKLEAMEPG